MARHESGLRSVAMRFRRALIVGMVGLLCCGAVAAAWAWLVEPRWIAVREVPIAWRGPRMRVAVLSDIHARPHDEDRVRRIVTMAQATSPDLIVLPGDFVDALDADAEKLAALAPLADLHAPLGVYAVLGNHDAELDVGDPTRRAAIIARLRELHVPLLENEHVELKNGVTLTGLGSWRAGQSDPVAAFASTDPRAPTLVFMHNFQSLDVPWIRPFDVAIAGHTHAGQICVPFTSICPGLRFDMKPYRYGLYDWPKGGKLYVTAGLGESGIHARLGARPEIAVLELSN